MPNLLPRIENFGVGIVVRSDNLKFKPGDRVYGTFGAIIIKKSLDITIIKNEANLPWTVYVGTLGMPGESLVVGLTPPPIYL